MSTRITICIITYQRPEGLTRLLESLAAMERPADAEVDILVVENDPERAGLAVCDAAGRATALPIRCVEEPRRGIPFARNRAVRKALDAGAELIAFIDDDEEAEREWLVRLTEGIDRFNADVATGPARPRLPDDAPAWLARSGVFEPRRFATGTERSTAYTNNVLVRRAVYERFDPPFDERLAATGGSDSHLFRRAHLAGVRIVWIDEAVTHEHIPASRATIGWVMRRWRRVGLMGAFIERDLAPGAGTTLRLLAEAGYVALRGAGRTILAIVQGRRSLARAAQDFGKASGVIAGLTGGQSDEYRTVHGR